MEGFNLNSNSEEEQLFVLYHHLFMNDQEGLHKFLSNHLTPGCSYAQKYHIFSEYFGNHFFFGFFEDIYTSSHKMLCFQKYLPYCILSHQNNALNFKRKLTDI